MAESKWRATLVRIGKLLFTAEPFNAEEQSATKCTVCTADCVCGEKCTAKGCGCCDACTATKEGEAAAEEQSGAAESQSAPDAEQPPDEPCATCESPDCHCGADCTSKGCGCCDGCVAAGEEDGEGDQMSAPPAEPTAEEAKALAAEVADLRAKLAAAQRGDKSKAKIERVARINAEADAFMKDHTAKWGMEKRAVFRSLYHGVKHGVVSLRRERDGAAADAPDAERFETLSAKLSAEASAILTNLVEALAKSDPGFDQSRITAGGPGVDAEVARAAGATPADADAVRDAKVQARMKAAPEKYRGPDGYAKAYHEILAEEAARVATEA